MGGFVNKVVLFLGIIAAATGARVITVPDSAATIAAGLSMARAGDTVLVEPGRYEENITWPGTDGIKLYSAAGPDSTVISGGGNGRVIAMGSGLTRATEIRGFEISGGKASSAAGIYCQGSPSIVGNRICGNEAHGERNYGGGILCGSGSSPLIARNEIAENVCSDTNTWNYGGGIYLDMNSTAEICCNLIAGNVCAEGYWNYGAGIYCGLRSSPFIYQNIIMDNLDTLGDRGHGAGIHVDLQARALVFNNLILNNRTRSDLWNYGAGIKVSGTAAIINNTIVGNACQGGTWANGGGIFVDNQDSALIKNNVIVQNRASGGGGIYNNSGFPYLVCNNAWNNSGGNYSGCEPGPGDISLDPLFASGAQGPYCLSHTAAGQPATSPCVDAGDTLLWTWPLNLDSLLRLWTTRTDSVPDQGLLDMGYHYPEVAVVGLSEQPVAPRPAVEPGFTVHPNPTRGVVVLHLTPRSPGRSIPLSVYDSSGRLMLQSAICNLQSEVPLDLSAWPPGVYLLGLDLAGGRTTQKLVVQN